MKNNIIVLAILILFINISNVNGSKSDIVKREFCLYTETNMVKVTNPFYLDDDNNTVYFDNIEKYAEILGPMWFGVAYCGNDTLVNSIGNYYKITKIPNVKKRDKSKDNDNDNNNNDKDGNDNTNNNDNADDKKFDGYFDNNPNENIYKIRTLEEYKEEYDKLYKNLMKDGLKSVSLTSNNPAYNPYHPALIRVKNVKHPNFIKLQYAYPYNLDKTDKYMEKMDEKNNIYKECGMIRSSPGSSLICS
ncbi:hypothetical protein PIROE2DRAFT_15878, partial [Piromyces sp. E2]